MTVYGGFLPGAPYKEELREHQPYLPSQTVQEVAKPRRPQVQVKPMEEYRYYVSLVVIDDGSIQVRSSPEMRPYKRMILEEAIPKLQEVMNDYIQPTSAPNRHPSMTQSSMSVAPRVGHFPPNSRKSTGKRRRQEAFQEHEQQFFMRPDRKIEAKQPTQIGRQLQIRVDDRKAQAKWFSDAFKAVQQVGCRTIAKVWIKKIHPKKQSTHPYNGGFPRDQPADANRTRPPYWPNGVIHKEPDHIDRNARTALLVHLIMNTPQPQIKSPQDSDAVITARDLFVALEEKRNEFKVDRWSIISEIINAREQIEMYEAGGFDADTVIHIPDFSECTRSTREDGDGDGDENELSASEPLSAGAVDEDCRGEEKTSSPTPSAAPSPICHTPSDETQTHHDPAPDGGETVLPDQGQAHQSTNSFSQAVNNFTSPASEQPCSAMTIATHVFEAEPKHNRLAHRMQQGRIPHELIDFQAANNRQQQDLLTHQWLANESPTGYLPHVYGLGTLHTPTQISPQDFAMSAPGLTQSDLQEMEMTNGLPIMDGMSYDGFPSHSRTMPVRAMSTPQSLMLEHPVHGGHGLGVAPSQFYTG